MPDASAWLSPIDARLIDRLHGDLPLVDRPFAAVAAELGLGEDEVLERLNRLLAQGVLTRFGPLYQIERAGGQFVLAAMAVPEDRFDTVVAQVNALPEVAHNYRREHAFNMWFVVAAETPAEAEAALQRIEQATGLPVLRLPKEHEYAVELKLDVGVGAAEAHHAAH
jgi:DNA-binding Lrp family transcriptional regulator